MQLKPLQILSYHQLDVSIATPDKISLYILGHLILVNKDFESGIYRTTFKPGQSHSNICVVIIDDDIREGNEMFQLLLAIPKQTQKLNVSVGKPFLISINIIGMHRVNTQKHFIICLIHNSKWLYLILTHR